MVKSLKNITWEAEEYIVRDHNTWWYIGLFIVGAALGVLAVFLEAWTFLAIIILSIITILISTFRPPRKIKYSLDKEAFGILKEESHFSAILIPKKRFGLSVKVYFPEGSGEAIVDALGARLPMEEVKLDLLDKLVNFLRI